jgi:ABC-2 type transport system permease protein
MISSLKAEIRKLFTVRSTYILSGFALAYMIFYNFYVVAFKFAHSGNSIAKLQNSHWLMAEVTRAGSIVAPILFGSIIAVLLMAHEYRYNTIMYTLTSSNSRNKTLAAKILAITGFSIIFALLVALISLVLAKIGLRLHHVTTGPQVFYYREFLSRIMFVGWAYGMIGLLLAVLFRNLVASIVALLLLPATIEQLVALMLNANQQQYLPFTAITAVLNNGLERIGPGLISAGRSALVALLYIVVFWIIAWILFNKRDAN